MSKDRPTEFVAHARLTIEDFGSVNVHLEKKYKRGHLERLLNHLQYAIERWQDETMIMERLDTSKNNKLYNYEQQ